MQVTPADVRRKFTATCPNGAIVATAGLDGLDLFEPMLAIRNFFILSVHKHRFWGNLHLALSWRSYVQESQTSILGRHVTLIAEEKSQSHYIW